MLFDHAVRSVIQFTPNVAFSRGAGWRGLCSAQTVTDRTVGYNAWFAVLQVDVTPSPDCRGAAPGSR